MVRVTRVGLAVIVLALSTLFGGVAHAESAPQPNPNRAAGWAVIGVGSSLGAGSIATGVFMLANPASELSEQRVGGATLAGGVVTLAIALAIGIPLAVTGSNAGSAASESSAHQTASTTLVRALAGEFHF